MSLSRVEFADTVQRLTALAERSPRSYFVRLVLMAALSYVALLLLITGLVAAIALSVYLIWRGTEVVGAISIVLMTIVTLLISLRSAWVRIPMPNGSWVARREAPGIWAMSDELAASLNSPPIHGIIVTTELNAAMAQRPLLGLFGWHRNYLELGLPLLMLMTGAELRSIVAHELGHLSRSHGRMSIWLYRIRSTWAHLYANVDSSDVISGRLIHHFLRWYAPRLDAYASVFDRAQEYEADRASVQIAGGAIAADALRKMNIICRFVEYEFEPTLLQLAEHLPDPPDDALERLATGLSQVSPATAQSWLDEAHRAKTSDMDSHPSLTDRIAAMGEAAVSRPVVFAPPPPGESAAETYFSPCLAELKRGYIRQFRESEAEDWKQRSQAVRKARARLIELDSKTSLNDEELCERATLRLELREQDAAERDLRDLLNRNPHHAMANLALGIIRLKREDESGLSLIDFAMRESVDAVLPGCGAIAEFLLRQGRNREALKYQERMDQMYELEQTAERERSVATAADRFQPCALADDEIDRIRAAVHACHDICEAFLVQKIVRALPHRPHHVVAIKLRYKFLETGSRTQQVCQQLQTSIGSTGSLLILPLAAGSGGLRRKLGKVPGAKIR